MTREEFVEKFGGIVEHSPWVAERAYDAGVTEATSANAIYVALVTELHAATRDEKLAVLRAHPDLAGRLAMAGELTPESKSEQASAGLDRLTEDDFNQFTALNNAYQEKFSFPFIIAVKGLTKDEILTAFKTRIENATEDEFETACNEVERIVKLRLEGLFD